jgi:RNA polymerase sigma-70 factor (ECF subfamily)
MQDADVEPEEAPSSNAVEHVYRSQGARLWRSVLAFAGDAEVANDAVAEAFAQLLRRGAEVRDPARWVWRAAFRLAAGELKRRGAFGSLDADLAHPAPEPVPADEALLAALGRLSPKQRGAVVLHHYAGYPVKEVAEIIGSTTAAVRVHLSQGRKRLRSMLEDER